MAWVLKTERHYTNGMSATFYHKGFPLGIMHECTGDPKEAQQFKTKKEATEYRKGYGLNNWEVVKTA